MIVAQRPFIEDVRLQFLQIHRHLLIIAVRHSEAIFHHGRRIVIHLLVLVVQADAGNQRPLVGEVQRRLVKQSRAQCRGIIRAAHQQFVPTEVDAHPCEAHHLQRTDLLYRRHHRVDILLQPAQTVGIERHRSFGMQRLVEQVHARHPLPSALCQVLQCHFFGPGMYALALLQRIDVIRQKILVHKHPVCDVLIARDGIHLPRVGLILQIQRRVKQAATIAALTVVGYLAYPVLISFFRTYSARIVVRISAFVRVVIVHHSIQLPGIRRQPDGSYSATSGLHIVSILVFTFLFTQPVVLEKAPTTLIVATGRESKRVADAVIMGERCTAVLIARSIA